MEEEQTTDSTLLHSAGEIKLKATKRSDNIVFFIEDEKEVPYGCGLCGDKVLLHGIRKHACTFGLKTVCITPDRIFFPPNEFKTDKEDQNFAVNPIDLLISEIQIREPIWNFKLPIEERKKYIKDRLWQQVADALSDHFTLDSAKKKWKNLVDTYRRYKLADEDSQKGGPIAKRFKSIKWQYYDRLSFLNDIEIPTYIQSSRSLHSEENNDSADIEYNCKSEEENNDENMEYKEILNNDFNGAKSDESVVQISTPKLLQIVHQKPLSGAASKIDGIKGFCIAMEEKLRKMNEDKANFAMFKFHELMYCIESNAEMPQFHLTPK